MGVAAVAVGVVSCGHGSTSTPTPAVTFTAAPTVSPNALTSPCAGVYAAYEPDGGTGNPGIQTIHYANDTGAICGSVPTTPPLVSFGSSVGPVAFAADYSTAIALLLGPSGTYDLAQDVAGASLGQLVPLGEPYNLDAQPTAAPTESPSPGTTTSPTSSPTAVPTLAAATSVSIVGSSTSSLAFVLGPAASSIVALTSLTNAPPQYGSSVPFYGSNGYATTPPSTVRSNVLVSPDGLTALVRGPSDLLSFSISVVASGYQFNARADDLTLGSGGVVLRGVGAMAITPLASTGRALVGGTTGAGTGGVLTLVTGLPNAITRTTSITLPGNINSIAYDPSGEHAYVATDAGIFSIGGVSTSVLTVSPAFTTTTVPGANQLPYVDCNGRSTTMSFVDSVRVSLASGNTYGSLVALGRQPGTTCATGDDDAVVAIPIVPSTGTTPSPAPSPSPSTTPIPTQFTQNNVVAPPSAADYFLVR